MKYPRYSVSATDLKLKVSEVLNEVYYTGREATIERHGKPIAKIVPIKGKVKKHSLEEALARSFGSIPDFPDVTKMRRSRQKSLKL